MWLGDTPLPAEFEAFGETWERHHPGWEMKLWRDSDLPPLRNREQFDRATSVVEKSDIARYELLFRFGGIYADTDFECLRPFDDLLAGVEGFIGTEDGTYLSIGLIGAVPDHPLLRAIVDAIPTSVADNRGGPPNQTTGPLLVTRLVDADPNLRTRLHVFAPEFFYPYLYNERYRRREKFPNSYAVHHWAGNWLAAGGSDVPPRYRLILATNCSHIACAAAVIKPFARLFGPQDPIELVLTVPEAPSGEERERPRRLLAALKVDPSNSAPIIVQSHAQIADAPYDLAVIPSADHDELLLEISDAVSWLHQTRASIDRHGRPAIAAIQGDPALAGDTAVLRQRLASFQASAGAPTEAPDRVPTAHRATYLGNDRLLVSTTWGGKLFMAASDLSLTPEVVHDGSYDVPFTRFLERTLRPGEVAFDVGANVGLFTLLMARIVGPSGRVVAYEAAPGNVALLRDNVAMNYYGGWVEIVDKAASASSGSSTSTRAPGSKATVPYFRTTRPMAVLFTAIRSASWRCRASRLTHIAGAFAGLASSRSTSKVAKSRSLQGWSC